MALIISAYLFQCAEPTHNLNVREISLIKYMLRVAVKLMFELFPELLDFLAPEISKTTRWT